MTLSTGISFSSLPQSDIIVALGQGRSQRCRLTPSFSMPDINGLGLSHTFGSIWSPHILSGSLLEHVQAHHPRVSAFVTAFNALRVQFSHLKHRIYGMETENNELRHANMVLRSDSQALEQELSDLRVEYYAERFQSKVRIQCARADKDKIIILTDKLEQAEKFIMAMVDIKLHEAVLGRAAEAVKEGADAEEALIDAVRVAATKKGSAWSRIIPAIVGPRSPEHYLSAINLALMLQKDLHESEKVASFWKTTAKLDPVNADTITPSSSLLSEVGGQDVEHSISEQAVLDEMIALLTNGDTLSRKSQPAYSAEVVASELILADDKIAVASIPIVNSSIIQPEIALSAKLISPVSSLPTTKERRTEVTPLSKTHKTVKITVSPPIQTSQIPVSPFRSKTKPSENSQSKLPSPISPSKLPSPVSPSKVLSSSSPASPLRISSKQPTTPLRKASLAPIRSRLSTPRTNTFKRPALTTIDLNRPVKMNTSRKPTNSFDDTAGKKPTLTRNQSKSLVKRRGVIMEEISHPPPSIVAKNENTVLPMTAEIEIYKPLAPSSPTCIAKTTETNNPASTSISTEDPIHAPISPADKESFPHCTEFDLSPENAVHRSLLTVQALLSLERICAAFSSDSLGSLEMTDEGTDYGDDSQSGSVDRNSNVVPPASLTSLSPSCKAVLDPECSIPSDSSFKEDVNLVVDEGPQASGPPRPPRPPTPIIKCSTWVSSTPCQRTSSASAASSSSSSSGSISIPASVHTKKSFQSNGSPTPARTPILASPQPSPIYSTNKLAKSVKGTFYKAVPPLQNVSLLPIRPNSNNRSQQPLLSSQDKDSQAIFLKPLDQTPASPGSSSPSFPRKLRSHTVNAVSPLPPTLSTPILETFSATSPFKPRSNTVTTFSPTPMSPTHCSPRSERHMPLTKQRSNTIDTSLPVGRPHTAKTISSSAKRRSNTLDSYLEVPSKNVKSSARTKAVSPEVDVTVPTVAFMRRPDVETTSVNTRSMSSAVPLVPNWCPALPGSVLSPTQYRNMLRSGANMGVR